MRRIETQSEVALQRRMALTDAIELGDLLDDVARCAVVAPTDLVFLCVQIFLAAPQSRRFANLETGIHAPKAGQRRRQCGADQKTRPAGSLQKIRIDVGCVYEQVWTEKLLDLGGGQFDEIVGQLLLSVAPGEI